MATMETASPHRRRSIAEYRDSRSAGVSGTADSSRASRTRIVLLTLLDCLDSDPSVALFGPGQRGARRRQAVHVERPPILLRGLERRAPAPPPRDVAGQRVPPAAQAGEEG